MCTKLIEDLRQQLKGEKEEMKQQISYLKEVHKEAFDEQQWRHNFDVQSLNSKYDLLSKEEKLLREKLETKLEKKE